MMNSCLPVHDINHSKQVQEAVTESVSTELNRSACDSDSTFPQYEASVNTCQSEVPTDSSFLLSDMA